MKIAIYLQTILTMYIDLSVLQLKQHVTHTQVAKDMERLDFKKGDVFIDQVE